MWLTGLSGAGKTTIATECMARLGADGRLASLGLRALILDGDELREGLNADLSFSAEDRAENVRRIGEVALLFARHRHLVLVPVISPYLKDRLKVRQRHEACAVPFAEVHVATALETCEARDPKGLYRRARAGEISQFTGISDPYEAPESPEVRIESEGRTPAESATALLEALERLAVVPRRC